MNKYTKSLMLGLVFMNTSCANGINNQQTTTQEITTTLNQQVNCWNNGDLKCFMDGYVNSDKTLFISGNKFIHGWQNSYDHYKNKYGDDKQGMGKLQITIDGIETIDNTHAYLYGRWHLVTNGNEYNGVTSLIFQKNSDKWQIVLDHSN